MQMKRLTVNLFWIGSIVCLGLLAATLTAFADTAITDGTISTVHISGTITNRDAEQLQELSTKLERKVPMVFLDSTGGEVSAAISIGRLIRKISGWTYIFGRCYSSCALIFIGGVERFNYGELGLHRPYLSSSPQSRETLEKQVPLMLSMIKSYVTEMGITDNFYQQMVNTEPSQMLTLGDGDSTALVPVKDAVFDEVETARNARRFGLTTAQMRQRDQDADLCLRRGLDTITKANREIIAEATFNCTEAVNWGLSERIYLERDARAKKECWFDSEHKFSGADRATLDNVPVRIRPDHPLILQLENCVRNVMLGQNTPVQNSWFKWFMGR
jgi:hypothetical protein